jgi:hypothetical protein
MAMRVDQPRQKRPALAVDPLFGVETHIVQSIQRANDLAVVSDEQPVETLQLPIGPNLNAVDVVDERVCRG